MTITIYNTLARREQPLQTLQPGKIGLYVCGITTYDYCHLGHARLILTFDVVQRWLRLRGYQLTYVRNITDIDDKIIKRAAERGVSIGELTEVFVKAMHEDFAALGCQPPDVEPRATQFIPQMLDLIGLLQEKGLAYQDNDGDVNFAVRRFPDYGKLSRKSLEDLRAGERVAVGATKRDPLDFVLWKRAKAGEPSWASHWGDGRPGWHIECSAMSTEILGRHFDIHGGGPDLIFPHHENEIAQSEGAFGGTFATTWMHCGALRVGHDKMSKSLDNFVTIRKALEHYDGEVLRFFLIRSQYRSQISFSPDQVIEARTALLRLYTALRDSPPAEPAAAIDWNEPHAAKFAAAMDEDFNTALATAVLFELASEVNRTHSPAQAAQLKALGGVLGLLQRDPVEYLRRGGNGPAATGGAEAADIEDLIARRAAAKKARDFATADALRTELTGRGIILEDGPGGTTWRRA
ncbi:MAG TPA: cysteine--tRNA ligase [Burkholderiaceae bacterium]|nr:cysteine--tRNA ligase [Burkholderiaceae bacterium]